MIHNKYKSLVEKTLLIADVQINGARPWDITVHNDNFYRRLLSGGSLALGEMYMEGWWDCESLDQFFFKVLRADLKKQIDLNFVTVKTFLQSKLFNLQTISKSKQVAVRHYDLGNELYQKMLDQTMAYTCGYWKDADNLHAAQVAKFDLICRKMGLTSGMKILDWGCGFGGFMKYAAQNYDVKLVGLNISKEQVEFGKELCKGLNIDVQLKDYREAEGAYDRIVSVGLLEHVGYKNYRNYMVKARELLADDGLLLIHTIGNKHTSVVPEPWLDKYIFPNGILPSLPQITKAAEDLFIIEDLENFGPYYDLTLMAWFKNFDASWPELKKDFDETFYRMWKYYLLSCAGMFRSREVQLWQIVLSKNGVLGGYKSIR